MSAEEPTQAQEKRRPTGWIVLCAVLGVAVVGLAIWAFTAQSDADDTQAKLDAQERAASQATPTPAPEPAEVDAETRARFEQVAEDLGAAGATLDEIERQLDEAAARVDEAVQARENAEGVIDTARAEAEAFQSQFELTRTCLRGTLDAVAAAYEGGGLETAVAELQRLSGSCRDVTSS